MHNRFTSACFMLVTLMGSFQPMQAAQIKISAEQQEVLNENLMIAGNEGDLDQVNKLIAAGADVNAKSKTGKFKDETALTRIVANLEYQKDYKNMTQLFMNQIFPEKQKNWNGCVQTFLKDPGIDILIKNDTVGMSAFDIALTHVGNAYALADPLRTREYKIKLLKMNGLFSLFLDHLKQLNDGRCKEVAPKIMPDLANIVGEYLAEPTELEHRLLHWSKIGSDGFMRECLDAGARINIGNHDGLTPLMLASLYGYEKAVQLLLIKGADTHLLCDGKTALEHAQKKYEAYREKNRDVSRLEKNIQALKDGAALVAQMVVEENEDEESDGFEWAQESDMSE